MNHRLYPLHLHPSIPQKVRVPGRTSYSCATDGPVPTRMFLWVNGSDCAVETIAPYDPAARLASIIRQYDPRIVTVGGTLLEAKFGPAGLVLNHRDCRSQDREIGWND